MKSHFTKTRKSFRLSSPSCTSLKIILIYFYALILRITSLSLLEQFAQLCAMQYFIVIAFIYNTHVLRYTYIKQKRKRLTVGTSKETAGLHFFTAGERRPWGGSLKGSKHSKEIRHLGCSCTSAAFVVEVLSPSHSCCLKLLCCQCTSSSPWCLATEPPERCQHQLLVMPVLWVFDRQTTGLQGYAV